MEWLGVLTLLVLRDGCMIQPCLRLAGANCTCLHSADCSAVVESDPSVLYNHDSVVVPVLLCLFLSARSASLLGFSHALPLQGPSLPGQPGQGKKIGHRGVDASGETTYKKVWFFGAGTGSSV